MWEQRCEELLTKWCEAMLALQIPDNAPEGLRGGILCPACARVHGRSLDALYPFVFMADRTGEHKWLDAAEKLFDWAQATVSRPDGAYACDTNNAWFGITVFSVVQMCEALRYHGQILDEDTTARWKDRIRKAADFLLTFSPVYHHNVNYRFANAVAMQMCGELFGEEVYYAKAQKCAEQFEQYLTGQGLLFGEGVPPEGVTKRGCRPVDLGYNVEESLPSLALYAELTGDDKLARKIADSFAAHLSFMLPDGAWDNSFGSRNFKWTYWGSRTSDGCLLGCLLSARYRPECLTAAQRNFELLEKCTYDGLLYGGMQYHEIGERPCVHHTFAHAKVLASLLDYGLTLSGQGPELPRTEMSEIKYYPEIDTFLIRKENTLATVSGYDWEYLKGGHASGGNLTMLWHPLAGPVLCATMNEYTMHEPNNQQLPRMEGHECLSPRLECYENGVWYTTLYDHEAIWVPTEGGIAVQGQVRDRDFCTPEIPLKHETVYRLRPDGLEMELNMSSESGAFTCPLISPAHETVRKLKNRIEIEKERAILVLEVLRGRIELSRGQERIYHLVGGFEALKTEIRPDGRKIQFRIFVLEKKR